MKWIVERHDWKRGVSGRTFNEIHRINLRRIGYLVERMSLRLGKRAVNGNRALTQCSLLTSRCLSSSRYILNSERESEFP